MKFKLSTVGSFYTVEDAKRLEELGFQFDDKGCDEHRRKRNISDSVELNISSLEELLVFSDKWGDLIINSCEITIFGNWCE